MCEQTVSNPIFNLINLYLLFHYIVFKHIGKVHGAAVEQSSEKEGFDDKTATSHNVVLWFKFS